MGVTKSVELNIIIIFVINDGNMVFEEILVSEDPFFLSFVR